MSMENTFGTLVDVDTRIAWAHEAHVFTPWLADNLDRLGEVIGIPLELTSREHGVGRFSADLVARSVRDDAVVLIENQLERSDHTHLGQIMTYLAGTEAKVIVWVAPRFCNEHLSAIAWLNQHSHADFSFFAVKLRVVRIGDSQLAPLFEVVEQPNEWDRTISQQVRQSEEPSGLTLTRRAFWDRYAEVDTALSQDRIGGGGSSRWRAIPNQSLLLSRYKSKGNVGIFLRGPAGMSASEVAERLRPFTATLEQALGTAPGRHGDFTQIGPLVTEDPATWDAAIHWLELQTRRYTEAIIAELPEDLA